LPGLNTKRGTGAVPLRISDADAARKSAPGKWSVLECLEHIVFVEGVYCGWLQNAALLDAPSRDSSREEWITAHVTDRRWDWQAPEVAHPKGRYHTVVEALAEFNEVRDRIIAAAREGESKLFVLQAKHSRLGMLNGAELLRLAAAHTRRHAEQIRLERRLVG